MATATRVAVAVTIGEIVCVGRGVLLAVGRSVGLGRGDWVNVGIFVLVGIAFSVALELAIVSDALAPAVAVALYHGVDLVKFPIEQHHTQATKIDPITKMRTFLRFFIGTSSKNEAWGHQIQYSRLPHRRA